MCMFPWSYKRWGGGPLNPVRVFLTFVFKLNIFERCSQTSFTKYTVCFKRGMGRTALSHSSRELMKIKLRNFCIKSLSRAHM